MRLLVRTSQCPTRAWCAARRAVALGVAVQALLPAAGRGQAGGEGTLQGTVYDSLAGHPLREATVQLVSGDTARPRTWSTQTDSAGRYRITGLPPGRYVAGFFHPLLDSLGFEPAMNPVTVRGGVQRADLAIPSAGTLLQAVCPAEERGDSTALLIGHVRRSRDRQPIGLATVAMAWTELITGALLVKPEERLRSVETTPEGWFAVCGIPGGTPVLARAAHEADSSGFVRVTMPAGGLRHVSFYVGGATPARDSLRGVPATVWRGEVPLAGRVLDHQGRPLQDAEVMVWGTGPSARTGARGRFALDSLPGGTQTLEVRAVGFMPVQLVVQLVVDGPRELEVRLSERTVALPEVAVRVAATRSLQLTRFYERMRDAEKGINHGYFITPEDMERRKPAFVTQMFDGVPGILVARGSSNAFGARAMKVFGPQRINIGGQRCEMNIFVDGVRVAPTLGQATGAPGKPPPSPEDYIDNIVAPSQVASMEVYPRTVQAPPQYQSLNGTCGVILIWTK